MTFITGSIPWNKGEKLSKETKAKVSNSIKEGFKLGRKTWNKDKKWSPEVIAKIKASRNKV